MMKLVTLRNTISKPHFLYFYAPKIYKRTIGNFDHKVTEDQCDTHLLLIFEIGWKHKIRIESRIRFTIVEEVESVILPLASPTPGLQPWHKAVAGLRVRQCCPWVGHRCTCWRWYAQRTSRRSLRRGETAIRSWSDRQTDSNIDATYRTGHQASRCLLVGKSILPD